MKVKYINVNNKTMKQNLQRAKTAFENKKLDEKLKKDLEENLKKETFIPNNNPSIYIPIQNLNPSPSQKILTKLQQEIKQERLNQNLTQRQLAYNAGLSQATITRAERHGWVSLFTMLKIISTLKKSLTIH